jgi:hypothetical protein
MVGAAIRVGAVRSGFVAEVEATLPAWATQLDRTRKRFQRRKLRI